MDKQYLTVRQAFERLQAEGITNSEPQVREWIRKGKIYAEMPRGSKMEGKTGFNRQAGYRVDPDSLERFIEERRPLDKWKEKLRKEVKKREEITQKLIFRLESLPDYPKEEDDFSGLPSIQKGELISELREKRFIEEVLGIRQMSEEEFLCIMKHILHGTKEKVRAFESEFDDNKDNVDDNNIDIINVDYINDDSIDIDKGNELDINDVLEIWNQESAKISEEKRNEIKRILFGTLFDNLELEGIPKLTNLYRPDLKGSNKYLCPFTNKRYKSAENLIKAAIKRFAESSK